MERPDTELLDAFLAGHIDVAGDSGGVADATVAAWQGIERALRPILGHGGVVGLYRRTLHLASATHPWLPADPPDTEGPEAAPARLHAALAQCPTAEAKAGATSFLRHFDALLSSLVGPALTARLLRPVWDADPGAQNEQDARP